jgi:hypothetical protein
MTDALMGYVLILYDRRLNEIGNILVDTFAALREQTQEDILRICLLELLKPGNTLKRHHSLEFVINRIDHPEKQILSAFEKYDIERSVDEFLNVRSQLPHFLKYEPIVYEYMLVKFGASSRVVRVLMKEILPVWIENAIVHKSDSSQPSFDPRWEEVDTIFHEYCGVDVSWDSQYLPLFKKSPCKVVIKYLFKGYLPKLFGLEVKCKILRTVGLPVLLEVTPVTQHLSKKRETEIDETQWLEAIYRERQSRDIMNDIFSKQADIFLRRAY